jgi:hypothetical protein
MWTEYPENKIPAEATEEDADNLSENVAYDVISWHPKHKILQSKVLNEDEMVRSKEAFFFPIWSM